MDLFIFIRVLFIVSTITSVTAFRIIFVSLTLLFLSSLLILTSPCLSSAPLLGFLLVYYCLHFFTYFLSNLHSHFDCPVRFSPHSFPLHLPRFFPFSYIQEQSATPAAPQ